MDRAASCIGKKFFLPHSLLVTIATEVADNVSSYSSSSLSTNSVDLETVATVTYHSLGSMASMVSCSMTCGSSENSGGLSSG